LAGVVGVGCDNVSVTPKPLCDIGTVTRSGLVGETDKGVGEGRRGPADVLGRSRGE
jgi:hypothetical protein